MAQNMIVNASAFCREITIYEKMLPVKAQRRKALPRFQGFLCAFAPLREKSFSAE
jgi:hypothetical protein